jgi:hypothetical protein
MIYRKVKKEKKGATKNKKQKKTKNKKKQKWGERSLP